MNELLIKKMNYILTSDQTEPLYDYGSYFIITFIVQIIIKSTHPTFILNTKNHTQKQKGAAAPSGGFYPF